MEKKVEGLVELNGLEEVMNVLEYDINGNEDNIEWLKEVMVKSGVYCISVGSRGEWENIEMCDEYENDVCKYWGYDGDDEEEIEGLKEWYSESMGEENKCFNVCYGEENGLCFVKVKM